MAGLHDSGSGKVAADAEVPPLPIPEHQLLRVIGEGSGGQVWLARSAIGAYRAVKIVSKNAFHQGPAFAGTVSADGFTGNGAGLTNVPGTFSWRVVSAGNIQLQSNLGYLFTTNAMVTFTLPSTANPGDVIYISSGGLGGWKILQNAGQSIKSPNSLLNYSAWTNRPVPGAAWTAVACSTNGQRIMGVSSSASGNYPYPFVLSADGGITWRTNSFGQAYCLASSADGSDLYVGEGFGFFNVSTDFGSSWAGTSLGASFNLAGIACSADGTKVYAAVGTSAAIFYSPDSGADWIQRQSGNWTGVACSSDGSKVVAGSSGNVSNGTNSLIINHPSGVLFFRLKQ